MWNCRNVKGTLAYPLDVEARRLVVFAHLWVNHAYSDFLGVEMGEIWKAFLQKLQDLGMAKTASELRVSLEAKEKEAQAPPKEASTSMPAEAKPFWTALTFPAKEMAQQFTVLLLEKLRQLSPGALANTPLWVKEDGKPMPAGDSPVKHLVDLINQLHQWVGMQVLNAADVRMKAKLLKHFVKIAQEAHKHTDLTTPYVIVSALKLVLSSEEKASKDMKEFRELCDILERSVRKDSVSVTSPTKGTANVAGNLPRVPLIHQYLMELSDRLPNTSNAFSMSDVLSIGSIVGELLFSNSSPSIRAVKEFIATPPVTSDSWSPLVAFVRSPPKPPSVSNLNASPVLKPKRAETTMQPAHTSNIVTFLHASPDVYNRLLKLLDAERQCGVDLLSDKAREAVLLIERSGGVGTTPRITTQKKSPFDRDDNSDSEQSEDSKVRRTVYSPMMVRSNANSTEAGSSSLMSSHSRMPPPRSPPPQGSPSLRSSGLPRARQWENTLLACGVPRDWAQRYAKLFDDEEIELSQLPSLDQKLLATIGLAPEHAMLLVTSK